MREDLHRNIGTEEQKSRGTVGRDRDSGTERNRGTVE